jgi:hypothetical protein
MTTYGARWQAFAALLQMLDGTLTVPCFARLAGRSIHRKDGTCHPHRAHAATKKLVPGHAYLEKTLTELGDSQSLVGAKWKMVPKEGQQHPSSLL